MVENEVSGRKAEYEQRQKKPSFSYCGQNPYLWSDVFIHRSVFVSLL